MLRRIDHARGKVSRALKELFHSGHHLSITAFDAKGADIVYGPIIQDSYRMKEFAVRDCDGHVLGFGQSLND